MLPLYVASFLVVTGTQIPGARSHGRLIEPPSRASMWRYGFQDSPPDYNDHELYCGGYSRQWHRNGGKCGICGDAWDSPQPRAHEAGGKYGQGVIVRKLKTGSTMLIRVELTANHRGFFEFRLCPNNNIKKVATQACLDKYVLHRARMSGKDSGAPDEMFHPTRFYPGTENKVYEMRYVLPKGLTCSQCVLQWRYIAGNNWGKCENGTEVVGCGPQEEFRACADIAVVDSTGASDDTPFIDNEVGPDDTNEIDSNGEQEEFASEATSFLFVAFVVLLILVIILSIVAVTYLYFHKAREIVKRWWNERKKALSVDYVKKFSCWKYLSKDKVAANEKPFQAQPVPPPRVKRTATIGFKGVPDNLV